MNLRRKEKDLTESNVIDLNEFRKGLDSGIGGDENWLKNLLPGTIFVARPKIAAGQGQKTLFLQKFMVLEHKTLSTNLAVHDQNRQTMDIWVQTLEFSRATEFVERIGWVEFAYEQPTTSETTDDNQGTV